MTRTSPRAPVKPAALSFFREAMADLLDSLDASVQLRSGECPEGASQALQARAALLLERLNKTNRLAKGRFVGPDRVTSDLRSLSDAAHRLDAAYVAYRRKPYGGSDRQVRSASALQDEIAQARATLDLGGEP